MKKRLKRIGLFLGVAVLGVGTAVSAFASSPNQVSDVNAAIAEGDVRIAVVRPVWWSSSGAYQPLRIADTEADITGNVTANITYVTHESWCGDSYYVGGGGFTEYATDGVLYYDLPIATITGKYFDLARLSTTDTSTASVWNRTATELFNASTMLHKIWRIWDSNNDDPEGIYRPDGNTAESRNVSNVVINSMLYGYLSCSSNFHNGYEAFGYLNPHFNLTDRTYDNDGLLGQETPEVDEVLDFVSEDDYATGRGDGQWILTSAKVAMMESLYNTSHPESTSVIGYFANNLSLPFIIGVSIIGLTGIAGLYILKKKRA